MRVRFFWLKFKTRSCEVDLEGMLEVERIEEASELKSRFSSFKMRASKTAISFCIFVNMSRILSSFLLVSSAAVFLGLCIESSTVCVPLPLLAMGLGGRGGCWSFFFGGVFFTIRERDPTGLKRL